jgi:hypothetical protein
MRTLCLGLLGILLSVPLALGVSSMNIAHADVYDCCPNNGLLTVAVGNDCDPWLNVFVGTRRDELSRARFDAREARRVYAVDQLVGADTSVLIADQARIDQADRHLAEVQAHD